MSKVRRFITAPHVFVSADRRSRVQCAGIPAPLIGPKDPRPAGRSNSYPSPGSDPKVPMLALQGTAEDVLGDEDLVDIRRDCRRSASRCAVYIAASGKSLVIPRPPNWIARSTA